MFIIHEMQTMGAQTALTDPLTYSDKQKAESAYHSKLASAAISKVPVHTVVLMDEHGTVLRREFYEHAQE